MSATEILLDNIHQTASKSDAKILNGIISRFCNVRVQNNHKSKCYGPASFGTDRYLELLGSIQPYVTCQNNVT
jgi:hypothetical protein